MDISGVLENYDLQGKRCKYHAFGSGNIHDTFMIECPTSRRYILQRLNTHVFRNPEQVIANYKRIFTHLENKREEGLFSWEIPKLYETLSGKAFFEDNEGSCWRLLSFIPHVNLTRSSLSVIHQAGRAFGRFIFLLDDLSEPPLNFTIQNFHDLEFRLREYENALSDGIRNRLIETIPEQNWIKEKTHKALGISAMDADKLFPVRYVHHDAKTDNILFSSGGKIRAIVDLDTVMPGRIHSDFGDAVRSFANTIPENDKRPESANFRLDIFSAYANGFLPEIKDKLSDSEKESLWQAPFHFSFMQGLRFLSDYLLGDIYYKTEYDSENLIKARNQIALAKSIEKNEERIKQNISSLLDQL